MGLVLAKETLQCGQARAMVLVRDPQFQTVTISTGTGAVVLGTVGGAFGTATGVVIGTTAGALPALFTFGLSLPVGAVAGGGMGLCGGAIAGGTAGAVCGAAAGHGGYTYQVHIRIKNGVITVHKRAKASAERGMVTIQEKASGIKATVIKTVDNSVSKAKKTYEATVAAARTRKVQVTAASAAGGAAVGAPVGGALGACSGVVVCGIVGLMPAIFTFGLSIPFCAAIGGGVGLCAGGTVGGSVGAVGGGAAYTYQKEIGETCQHVQKKVVTSATAVQEKVVTSATELKLRLSGTGGTA